MIPTPVLSPPGAVSSARMRIWGAPLGQWQGWSPSEADFPWQHPWLILAQIHCCLLLCLALYIICSLAPFQTYLAMVVAEDIYTAGVWNNMENLWSQGLDSHIIPMPRSKLQPSLLPGPWTRLDGVPRRLSPKLHPDARAKE